MTEVTISTDDLLTLKEAAHLLHISRQTLYNWLEKGQLRSLVLGRSRYLLRAEVEALPKKGAER